MNYNISTTTPPAMPNLGKGTECIKLLLTQASKDMHEPFVPMLFPLLARISAAQNLISRPEFKGTVWLNGQFGAKKQIKYRQL